MLIRFFVAGRPSFDFSIASIATRTVAYTMYSGGSYAPSNSPCGANCSYSTILNAPALQCNNTISSADNVTFWPSGLSIYWNAIPFGGVWESTKAVAGDFAVEYGEDSMWDSPLPTFACWIYNASYTIEHAFGSVSPSGSSGSTSRVLAIEYQNRYPFMGAPDIEDSGVTDPIQIETSNFEAIKNALYTHLNGTLFFRGHSAYVQDPPALDVMSSNVALYYNETGLAWVPDVPSGLEQLMQNITLSFAAQALSSSTGGPMAPATTTVLTTCTLSSSSTVYIYHSSILLIAYGTALAICLLSVVSGIIALRSNGFGGGVSFTAFLDAFRNPALADPARTLDEGTRLRYGKLVVADGRGWDAFGREGEVTGRGEQSGVEGFPLLVRK